MRVMRTNVRAVLGVATGVVIAVTFPILNSGVVTAAGGTCPACSAGLVSTPEVYGGDECPHGPEWDSDCGSPPTCCEDTNTCGANGGADGNGICSCFSCGNAPGQSEEDLRYWMVWCGPGAGNPCVTGPAPAGPYPQGPIRTAQSMTASNPTGPTGCSPQGEYESIPHCGGAAGGATGVGCKAPENTCTPFGPVMVDETGDQIPCP